MARRLIATGTTGTDGSCIIPFIGTGAGKVDLEVETEISGEVITKNISILDTLLYDTGTDPTHEIWTGHTEELTRGAEYSTLRESSSPNPTNIDTVMPVGPWVLTMDIKRDGHFTNWDINIMNNNVSVFGCATPTNDVWTSITLIYDGSKIDYYENGTTLVKSVDVVLNVDKDTVLRLQTPQDITYLDFKDLMVVREGSSSIVCGASKDIIRSGEVTNVTARLYENGVIVKNTNLDVYKDGSKVGTVSTGSTGVASYSYTGAGVGEVEFYFKKGSILSEIFVVYDTLYYDTATSDKTTDYTKVNSTLTFNTNKNTITRNADGECYVELDTSGRLTLNDFKGKKIQFECNVIESNEDVQLGIFQYVGGWQVVRSSAKASGLFELSTDIDSNATLVRFRVITNNLGSSGSCSFNNLKLYQI